MATLAEPSTAPCFWKPKTESGASEESISAVMATEVKGAMTEKAGVDVGLVTCRLLESSGEDLRDVGAADGVGVE